MSSMPSPKRDQFETDDAYYWTLSDYYESAEGEAEILAAMERGARDGTARYGADAAAAGRKMLLQSVGLPEDSAISGDELTALVLADAQAQEGARTDQK